MLFRWFIVVYTHNIPEFISSSAEHVYLLCVVYDCNEFCLIKLTSKNAASIEVNLKLYRNLNYSFAT